MSIRFIFGRSGSGKTSYCVNSIVESLTDNTDTSRLIFLVPEQASYQAERAILSDSRVKGYNRLNVLSFDRLQFMLLGKTCAKANLSQVGRQMLVQRLLYENKDSLKVFGRSAYHIGSAVAIASTIKELHQYGRSAEEIDRLVETLKKYDSDSLTTLKFADIALLYKAYIKTVSGSFADTDMQLNLAAKAVAKSPLARGAKIWIDGFAGFTVSELCMLTELLQVCSQGDIALCMDAEKIDLAKADIGNVDSTSLFGMTEVTYCDLMEIIKKRNLKLQKPVILKEALRFKQSPALAHIEKELFAEQPMKITSGGNIKIAALSDMRGEVRFVAREIVRLIKEENYRYRDIAVITSDIDCYEHYLRAYLADYNIPYFIDKRERLSQHPVIVLLNAALAIVENGFEQSDIFTYLKTNLAGVEIYDIDVLENYCIAYGIKAGDWRSESKWDFADKRDGFDNNNIDRIRRAVAAPLIGFSEKLKAGDKLTAVDFTKAVYEFFDGLLVWRQLNDITEKAIADGDTQKADLHRQFCQKFWDVFDEMTELLGGLELSINEFSQILKNAFSQMTLAFIPPRLDQVLVGSIERSRHPELKTVFLLGCTDKQFPSPVSFDRIITETDRQAIGQNDFKLGPGLKEQLAGREYLAYIAFTRPSDKLYITFPLTDSRGSEVVHSRFIDALTEIFSNLKIENVSLNDSSVEQVNSENELVELLCDKLGSDSEADAEQRRKLSGLLEAIGADNQLIAAAAKVNKALNYDNTARLEKEISDEFLQGEIRVSATRLNTIASCRYQYFAKYILNLTERKEFKFEPLDKGSFYHKVLENAMRRLISDGLDITQLSPKQLESLIAAEIDRLLKEDSFISHFYTHSNHNAYIIDSLRQNLDDFIVAAAQMIKAGDFRPGFTEVKFGAGDSRLGQCIIKMPGDKRLILNGLIDRLDTAEIDGEKLAVVFDYKLSGRKFNFSKFYYGLDLQIPIYLLAVKNGTKSDYEPIGGFFLPVESAAESSGFEKFESASEKFAYKGRGILNGKYASCIDKELSSGWSKFYNFGFTKNDGQYGYYKTSGVLKENDFERLMDFTRRKIIELVNQMINGQIDISPYLFGSERPCQWCKYKSVCRFEWQFNDYRSLQAKSKESVLGIEDGGDE